MSSLFITYLKALECKFDNCSAYTKSNTDRFMLIIYWMPGMLYLYYAFRLRARGTYFYFMLTSGFFVVEMVTSLSTLFLPTVHVATEDVACDIHTDARPSSISAFSFFLTTFEISYYLLKKDNRITVWTMLKTFVFFSLILVLTSASAVYLRVNTTHEILVGGALGFIVCILFSMLSHFWLASNINLIKAFAESIRPSLHHRSKKEEDSGMKHSSSSSSKEEKPKKQYSLCTRLLYHFSMLCCLETKHYR